MWTRDALPDGRPGPDVARRADVNEAAHDGRRRQHAVLLDYTIVTDHGAPTEIVESLRQRNVEVIVAGQL